MEKKEIKEPKSPHIGESVKVILKHIEIPCERFMGSNYVGPKIFTQDIRVYVVFENGSVFENRTNNNLENKDDFPKEGFFEKTNNLQWKIITDKEFYKKTSS